MRAGYQQLPGDSGRYARPVLDLMLGGTDEFRVRCLVDSGALHTLLPGWVADLAGIDCTDAPTRSLAVGGGITAARMVTTLLTVGKYTWEADVGFCDSWPHGFGLLGQTAFFRYFVVTFRAADLELEIEPVPH